MIAILALWEIPALVGLGVAIVALAYLVVLWATRALFGGLLSSMASQIPFVGSFIAGAITNVIAGAANIASGWAASAAYPLVRLILIVPQVFIAIVGSIVNSVEWFIGQVVSLGSSIAQNVAWISAELADLLGQVIAHTGLISLLQNAVASVASTVSWVYQSFVPSQIRAAVSTAYAAAASLVAGAETVLRAEIQSVAADAAATEHTLAVDIANVETNIQTQVWPAIDNLGVELRPLLTLALPVAFPLLLTRVATLEATWTPDVLKCVNAGCNALNPFLSMLNTMQDVAMLAGLAALLSEMVADPNGMAHATAAVTNDLLGIGRAIAGEFTGLGL